MIKPSPTYIELYSPAISSLLLLTTLNPATTRDAEFSHIVEPLRRFPVLLTSQEEGGRRTSGLTVDLDREQVQQLNSIIKAKGWSCDIAAIAVIEEIKSSVVRALTCDPNLPTGIFISVSDLCLSVCLSACLFVCTHGLLFQSTSTLLPNFTPVSSDVSRSRSLRTPPVFMKIAWDIMVKGDKSESCFLDVGPSSCPPSLSPTLLSLPPSLSPGPVVLVCGPTNTGKSTLCRFISNYLLNRSETSSNSSLWVPTFRI